MAQGDVASPKGSIHFHYRMIADGDNTYSATAVDSDGDTGSGDTITVSADDNSWSDTGMDWSGPDIYVSGGATGYWTTPPVSDYS